jgi:hypothetical protein
VLELNYSEAHAIKNWISLCCIGKQYLSRNIGRTELLSKLEWNATWFSFFSSCAVKFLLGNQLTDSIACNAHMTFTILNFSFCSYSTRDYILISFLQGVYGMYVILAVHCNLPTSISHSFTTNDDEKLMKKHWNRILNNDTFEEQNTFHWTWDFSIVLVVLRRRINQLTRCDLFSMTEHFVMIWDGFRAFLVSGWLI